MRLTIPLTGYAPMGLEPVNSDITDGHGDQLVTDVHSEILQRLHLREL